MPRQVDALVQVVRPDVELSLHYGMNHTLVRPAHLAALLAVVEKQTALLQSLLNKVNVVTVTHRHGAEPFAEALDGLCNRQIEVEAAVREIEDTVAAFLALNPKDGP